MTFPECLRMARLQRQSLFADVYQSTEIREIPLLRPLGAESGTPYAELLPYGTMS